MSNFADNKSFSQIFHESQVSHYGVKGGEIPHMSSPSQNTTQSNARATHRKPVGSSSSQKQDGPYPAGPKSSVPSRKPVGSGGTRPSTPRSPARANRSGAPDLNKALPRIPTNAIPPFIARDPTGKFDEYVKSPEGILPQSPIGYPPHHAVPALAKEQLASLPPVLPPPSPHKVSSRPGSSKGLLSMSRKRTNSGASSVFPRSDSRRGSLSEAAKDAGKWAKSKADILTMNQTERNSFMQGANSTRAREMEAARRSNPSSRPPHQQGMIVEKQKASHPGEGWGSGPVSASYAAQMEEREFCYRASKEYRARHEEACTIARMNGQPRPKTPEMARWSPPTASNSEVRAQASEFDPESYQMLTKSEKMALQLSRKLDAFKSNRKASDSSDMDFGMTDAAPVGAMQYCGEVENTPYKGAGCHMPSRTHLKAGLCENCYAYRKNADSRDPSPTPRKRGYNPKPPEDDVKGGNLYIRLPSQQKLRKVRNTVYEDPGNPFEFEASDLPLLPSISHEVLTVEPQLTTSHGIDRSEMIPSSHTEPKAR